MSNWRGWLHWSLAMLFVAGCSFPVREQVDLAVCDLAAHPLDPGGPLPPADQASRPPTDGKNDAGDLPRPRTLSERLRYPPDLPASNVPPIQLPPSDPKNPAAREAAINRLYPGLPPLSPEPDPQPGPEGHPLTLADLQRLATSNSPLIRQASADLEAAKGAAIQAGLYPNPIVGSESDVMGTGGTAGLHGAYFDQMIKTAGKLKLAQAAAVMDVWNSQLALRRAQADLAARVRAGYFGVLVARKTFRITRALAQFTDEVFRIQVELVKGTEVAAYEPLQLRVLAMQARANVVQARNRYTAAWKELTATLGLPAMAPTELAGDVDVAIPAFEYDRVLGAVLQAHTDIAVAENVVRQARYNLRLAEVTPIPDVDVRVMVQKDNTTVPHQVVPSVVVGMPLPVWNRNQGNIIQAKANLVRAVEEPHRVRTDLTARVAEAFERYENNRILLQYYRSQILPDQVRAYRGAYERHQQEPNQVGFGDVVVAQQVLATTVTTYVSVLGAQWVAVVDLAHLLQTNDFFQTLGEASPGVCAGPLPDLEQLFTLPCCHPCSPMPDQVFKGANGAWPKADVTAAGPQAPGQETRETQPAAPPGSRDGKADGKSAAPPRERPEGRYGKPTAATGSKPEAGGGESTAALPPIPADAAPLDLPAPPSLPKAQGARIPPLPD